MRLLAMSDRQVFSVSELVELLNREVSRFRDVHVEGEVTDFRNPGKGHLYFSIKDGRAQLRVVMFSMYARELKFRIENGLKLILRGKLNIYEQKGDLQLMADSAEPAGLGALQLAFEQLKARLAAEGLFDAARKKPIPSLPQRIAIVTSPSGAAIRDILNVLGRRFEGLSIQIYPVRVQGPMAAREIATAIRDLSRWNIHDVVLICRGGGSLEDLWPFNEEIVARAIAACTIPTISGVGHEIDFTISDFVADVRAATPSAAAEIVIRAKDEICFQIDQTVRRIRQVVEGRVQRYRHELRHLASSDGIGLVRRRVQVTRQRLQAGRMALYRKTRDHAAILRRRLQRADEPLRRLPIKLAISDRRRFLAQSRERALNALRGRVEREREAVGLIAATLQAVSPLSVLSRGYAIASATRNGRQRILRDSNQVAIGDPVEVQLKKGRLSCTVEGKSFGLERLMPLPPAKTRSPETAPRTEVLEEDDALARK
jgi:exodeoxyribonuclease VII large subunit